MLTDLFHSERLIHSIKTALACLIGVIITNSVHHLSLNQWLVITIIVVMCAQASVGGMLQKSYMRFLGTLLGSLFAIVILLIFGKNTYINAAAIGMAGFIFSYVATSPRSFHEAGTLGAATVTIILLGPNPTVITSIERCLEISLGILIAAVISQFILPINARTHLRYNQANTFKNLRNYYQEMLIRHPKEQTIDAIKWDEIIVQSLIKQRQQAKDASRELFGKLFNANHFMQLLWCEREILRAISFMHQAYAASSDAQQFLTNHLLTAEFNTMICKELEKLAVCLETKSLLNDKINIPCILKIRNGIHTDKSALPPESIIYIDGYLFSAGILVERLKTLEQLINERFQST